MKVKAISLLSGGLDSLLATKVILEQGIEVLGVTFETPFFSARKAQHAAVMIGISLLIQDITEELLEILKAPIYGYGKNMNPCIDCHTLMLNKAGRIMEESGADFIFTGEVLGQRPMSQNRQSLYIVAKNSGYGEYILRPLSAKFLTATKLETAGKIDREKLLDIQGRGRKHQLALARHYGITDYSSPAGGCLLTDPLFSKRLKDLFDHQKDFKLRDVNLLKYGRHFRPNTSAKVIVGRNSVDNESLLRLSEEGDTVIHMANFPGPTVLVPYECGDQTLLLAASLCALYSDAPNDVEVEATCRTRHTVRHERVKAVNRDEVAGLII
ncbi:MAG: tRNA 4-thiouridine(8) synthase ThiI [Deltaproteobacteria bacterium]|nr:tRNA 4-thiouridine(8) synthase ThiI [Deltaproteobacteria bacterium]